MCCSSRREILESWRKESRCKGTLPKSHFPGLLAKLHNTMKPENLVAAFRGTGIHPLDKQQVMKRLPTVNRDEGASTVDFSDSVMDLLKKTLHS